MLFVLLLFLAILFLFVIKGKGNVYNYAIFAYFVAFSANVFLSIIYISKLSTLKFPFEIDYEIYDFLKNIKIHIFTFSRIQDICFALMMFASLYLLKLLYNFKLSKLLTFSIPILLYIFLTDYSVRLNLYIFENTTPFFYNGFATKIINILCIGLLILYTHITPICYFIDSYKSNNFVRRNSSFLYGGVIFVIDLLTWFVFGFGTFSGIMFFNVDPAKIPINTITEEISILVTIIIILTFSLILATFFYFKPYTILSIIKKKEMHRFQTLVYNNLHVMMHMFKNAFLSIDQYYDIIESNIKSGNIDDAISNIGNARKISSSHRQILEKTIGMVHNPTSAKFELLDIKSCIDIAVKKAVIPENIKFKAEFEDKDMVVLGDKIHIVESFLNIINNAFDALCDAKSPEFIIQCFCDRELCIINFADSGCGISKKNMSRIFDMFFSTKAKSSNFGIGLDYVKKVIKYHHGHIELYKLKSRPEMTNFQVILPLHTKGRRGK